MLCITSYIIIYHSVVYHNLSYHYIIWYCKLIYQIANHVISNHATLLLIVYQIQYQSIPWYIVYCNLTCSNSIMYDCITINIQTLYEDSASGSLVVLHYQIQLRSMYVVKSNIPDWKMPAAKEDCSYKRCQRGPQQTRINEVYVQKNSTHRCPLFRFAPLGTIIPSYPAFHDITCQAKLGSQIAAAFHTSGALSVGAPLGTFWNLKHANTPEKKTGWSCCTHWPSQNSRESIEESKQSPDCLDYTPTEITWEIDGCSVMSLTVTECHGESTMRLSVVPFITAQTLSAMAWWQRFTLVTSVTFSHLIQLSFPSWTWIFNARGALSGRLCPGAPANSINPL